MDSQTPKQFVLQLGSLASLYLSLIFFLVLIFGLITVLIPSPADSVWEVESAQSMMRVAIAFVVVFFPTYLVLTRIVNQQRRKFDSGKYLGLTRWLIYLSLLVGGTALLIDLVVVIMAFLEGDITERFLLKALSVLIVVGGATFYYVKDAQGYWLKNENKSKGYGLITASIVLVFLVLGFMNIETPEKVREMKVDQQVVGALQDVQWRIEDFYRSNDRLPENLEELYSEFEQPTAPEGRESYRYEATGDLEYKICGQFTYDSIDSNYRAPTPRLEKNYDWRYKTGDWCFEREIDNEYRQ